MRYQKYLFVCLILCCLTPSILSQSKTENVILITFDGARTQEVFGGLDLEILKSKVTRGKVEDNQLYKKYWAETPEERRLKLMPFFWGDADERTWLHRRKSRARQQCHDDE